MRKPRRIRTHRSPGGGGGGTTTLCGAGLSAERGTRSVYGHSEYVSGSVSIKSPSGSGDGAADGATAAAVVTAGADSSAASFADALANAKAQIAAQADAMIAERISRIYRSIMPCGADQRLAYRRQAKPFFHS